MQVQKTYNIPLNAVYDIVSGKVKPVEEYTFITDVSMSDTSPLIQDSNNLTGEVNSIILLTGQLDTTKNGYYNYVFSNGSYELISINEIYLLAPCNSPDTDSIKIRAVETETIQTEETSYYLLDSTTNGVIALMGLAPEEVSVIKTTITEVMTDVIDHANDFLSEYGINLSVELEVIFPYETSLIAEVPSISEYSELLELETIAYLTNCEVYATESIQRKQFINAAVVYLKDSVYWNALDVITILGQSPIWPAINLNKNLKTPVHPSWLNHYIGAGGSVQVNAGISLDGTINNTFINLGYQPLAEDFNIYFPTPQFSKNSASITVKINNFVNSGTILRRAANQDLMAFDFIAAEMTINLTGGNDPADIVTFAYGGAVNGIWTLNRLNATDVQVWKDGVLVTTVTIPSADFEALAGYTSLGYGSVYTNALDATYSFAAIGRGMAALEVQGLHTFIDNYYTGLPTNNVGVFV